MVVKVNFKGSAVDATLDTAASLSAMRAELVPENAQNRSLNSSWSAPPIQLANNTACETLGITWQTIGFMGKRVYQRFVVIPDLSSPLVLGMDFMICISLPINMPTRTVIMGDNTPCLDELDDVNSLEVSDLEDGSMMFLEVQPSALHDKVEEANLERGEKAA